MWTAGVRPVGRSRRDRRRGERPPVSRQPSTPKGEPVASLSCGRGRPRPQPCSSYLQENAGSRRASAAVSARPPYRRKGGMSACVFCAERLGARTAPSATTLGAKGLRAPDCAPAVSAAKTIHSSLFVIHFPFPSSFIPDCASPLVVLFLPRSWKVRGSPLSVCCMLSKSLSIRTLGSFRKSFSAYFTGTESFFDGPKVGWVVASGRVNNE